MIGGNCLVIALALLSAILIAAERPWFGLAQIGIAIINMELLSRNRRFLRTLPPDA